MSQTFSGAMTTALAQELTFLCRIWELVLTSGETFYFTDNNENVTYNGQLYKFDPGIQVSAIAAAAGAVDNNCTVTVSTSANFLTMARIRQGALDSAQFDLYVIDWRAPDTYGRIERFSGYVSDVSFHDKGAVVLELTGDIRAGGKTTIGELYSRTCRALLGDNRCKVDLEPLATDVTITNVSVDGYTITATELVGMTSSFLKFGKIKWATGLNIGLEDELKDNSDIGTAELMYTPRNPVAIGDTGRVYPGCDKQVETCGVKFANLLNFRGEPYAQDQVIISVGVPAPNTNQQPLDGPV